MFKAIKALNSFLGALVSLTLLVLGGGRLVGRERLLARSTTATNWPGSPRT